MSKNTTDLKKQLAEYGAVFVADTVTIMPDKLEQLISDRERLAYLEGQKAGKNNYHLGYLSKDDQYAIERETIAARIDTAEKLRYALHPHKGATGIIDNEIATLRKQLPRKEQTDE